ncbi:MAG: TonB domain protein [Panacagrimonas sp.]|jgi:outer membrane receptor protein involved in Fe transport|nr:TonB domain protein [Panacagrimonas sp.]
MLLASIIGVVPVTSWSAEAAAPSVPDAPTIEVFSSSPSGPAHGDAQRATANVQSLDAEDLARPGNRSIADGLQDLGSVFATDATGNPFQPDLFYRGYSASPLLGLPQGLAVYQDGVRVNEAFGDTVNFDLVPLIAVSRADLIPGSNPVFGRNTLAGALALTTKSGFDAPGLGMQLGAGDFRRGGAAVEYGMSAGAFALYLAGEAYEEKGWRDHSRSRVSRVFTRGSWKPDDATRLDLSLSGADNRLRGNGAVPFELLDEEGRDAVFTYPDETRPRMLFANLQGSRTFAGDVTVSVGTHYRRNRTGTFNGDGTEFGECEDPANVDGGGNPFLCEGEDGDEEVVEDLDGAPVVASEDNDSATQNRSRTEQESYGLSAQAEWPIGAHRIVAGVSADFGDIEFVSDTELARLTASRGTVGSRIFVGESVVDVDADNDSLGVFLMDTWRATDRLEITAAGRFNHTRIELRDQIPDGDLSGKHTFDRFNPMLGASYLVAPRWTVYGSLAQSTRAPTPVELTCANPDDPCRLPNGFVDDPPLDEVVTRTAELGLRHRNGRWGGSVSAFRAISDDDILFITDSGLTNTGYFDNVGETLRQGFEVGMDVTLGLGWRAGLQYTLLVAEFRDDFLVNSPNHPLRDEVDEDLPDASTRTVRRGDRIPLIPRQQGRATLGWADERVDLEVEFLARGSSRYRGDEANVDSQKIDPFVVVNVGGTWALSRQLSLFASIDNLFDRNFETFGVYGEGDEVLGDAFEDARRFVGPGSPRRFEAGLRLRF